MRNLERYPVTLKEITDCLIKLHDGFSREDTMGDMRPILLEAAINILNRAGFVMHDTKLGFITNNP